MYLYEMLTNIPWGEGNFPLLPSAPSSSIWICHFIYLTYLFMEWLMHKVRRCVWTEGHPRLAVGTTPTAPRVRSAPSPTHAVVAAPTQGWSTGTLVGWASPLYCSLSCSAEQAGEGMCPSPVALAEGEVATDSDAAFALLDPREFVNFYNDLETSWCQHLVLGLSEAQRDSSLRQHWWQQ